MDEPYLLAAAQYVELNPVRAGLVPDAADWPWSRQIALVGPRRPIGAGRSDAGDGRQLARTVGQCNSGRGTAGFPGTWSHRLSVRKCHVRGSAGAVGRSYPPPTESRSPVKIAQTAIIGSCPRNCPARQLATWTRVTDISFHLGTRQPATAPAQITSRSGTFQMIGRRS